MASVPVGAVDWTGAAAAGVDVRYTPAVNGNGWVLLDLRGGDAVAGGDFHLTYNTDTLQVALEGIPLGRSLELALAVKGEALVAGVLPSYYQGGLSQSEHGFQASYGQAWAALKWHVTDRNSLELVAAGRRWFFGASSGTAATLVLPPETWVFEPRLRYTFWDITSPGEEWEAHRMFPRIQGVALGVEFGMDLRSDPRAWGMVQGVDDGRNHPGDTILSVRQWLRAGGHIHPAVRLELAQSAAWGNGEDDLTRVRAGGMNPYVIPAPGLPWAALLSERLVSAEGSIHWSPGGSGSRHELGAAVAGGVFNDVYRVGALDTFGVAAGVSALADLRFGVWQVHLRAGYALPTPWLRDGPHLSALLGVGARLF